MSPEGGRERGRKREGEREREREREGNEGKKEMREGELLIHVFRILNLVQ